MKIRAMKIHFLSALFVLAALPLSASAASSIDGYQWHNRLLIVFANDAASVPLAQQRAFADEGRARYAERDLVPVEVIGNDVKGTSESAAALRQCYGVAANMFRVLLIGKDGGVKLQSAEPIDPQRIFGTIDAMPMRREETQRAPKS
ncbi:hypothetical protein BRCH_00212c [Candidatus Burkholderia brachyanthoides]|nr:hypothetical protein BRCH_00212c [Candidatus Burkholderia brachyanthoides]